MQLHCNYQWLECRADSLSQARRVTASHLIVVVLLLLLSSPKPKLYFLHSLLISIRVSFSLCPFPSFSFPLSHTSAPSPSLRSSPTRDVICQSTTQLLAPFTTAFQYMFFTFTASGPEIRCKSSRLPDFALLSPVELCRVSISYSSIRRFDIFSFACVALYCCNFCYDALACSENFFVPPIYN